ncbi:substrate-binding domain-containing protein [Alteraurantiacibacter palmitatis]|uniref:Substrate-binding domain-containing protein n=1 Tax=Alteraurantiacibacter palmitatis TaxID=2054628 RepID=A0ABV7E4K7_9SPHN
MTNAFKFAAAALGAIALAACGSGGGSTSNLAVRAVGSSTVYPFATVVSELFSRNHPDLPAPLIESTGTGGGIALFCAGDGAQTPSIANASRRMKVSEFETCQANGVTDIIEVQIGMDGVVMAAAKNGITLNLTPEMVYRALAANPYGQPQTARNWNDVDPSLPALPILVYGPPTTSGTRDSFNELILMAGCDTNADMKALKDSDEDRHKQVCTEVRSDGAYVDQGEQDNLIVQKIESNPNAVGVFGYSYMEENLDRVRGVPMGGVEPTYDNIASFAYPGARAMFIYVKKSHIDAIPGLREFLATWAESWGRGGPLAQIGLVVNPDDVMARSNSAITELRTLTAADFQ